MLGSEGGRCTSAARGVLGTASCWIMQVAATTLQDGLQGQSLSQRPRAS